MTKDLHEDAQAKEPVSVGERILTVLDKVWWVFPLAGLVLGYNLPGSPLLYMFGGGVIAYGIRALRTRGKP